MLVNCGVGEDSWESLGLQGDPTKSILNEISPEYSLQGLMQSWNSNTLATWCGGLTHWKRPWWWERLKAGGEGDDRGWDGWMASLTLWTWDWVNSGSWWWTGKPGVLQFMGSKWSDASEWLNWTQNFYVYIYHLYGQNLETIWMSLKLWRDKQIDVYTYATSKR